MITINKEFSSIKLDLSTLVCTQCGSSNFKFQVTAEDTYTDTTVYHTSDDYKQTILGLDCIDCNCGYSFEINLSKEEK